MGSCVLVDRTRSNGKRYRVGRGEKFLDVAADLYIGQTAYRETAITVAAKYYKYKHYENSIHYPLLFSQVMRDRCSRGFSLQKARRVLWSLEKGQIAHADVGGILTSGIP